MKHKLIMTMLAAAVAMVAIESCSPSATKEQATAAKPVVLSQEALLQRGAYLVGIMGCNDCHSPKVFTEQGPIPDPQRLLSGHPAGMPLPAINKGELNNWVLFGMHNTSAVGPWGVSFAANLTSDATGIGSWSLEQFKTAMRQGKYKGLENGRMLLPPMPWPNYQQLTDDDLEAIFTYLKSTKPVQNVVPSPIAPADM